MISASRFEGAFPVATGLGAAAEQEGRRLAARRGPMQRGIASDVPRPHVGAVVQQHSHHRDRVPPRRRVQWRDALRGRRADVGPAGRERNPQPSRCGPRPRRAKESSMSHRQRPGPRRSRAAPPRPRTRRRLPRCGAWVAPFRRSRRNRSWPHSLSAPRPPAAPRPSPASPGRPRSAGPSIRCRRPPAQTGRVRDGPRVEPATWPAARRLPAPPPPVRHLRGAGRARAGADPGTHRGRGSKTDSSQSLDLQRDALRAAGVDDPVNVYLRRPRRPAGLSTAPCGPCGRATCSSSGSSTGWAGTWPTWSTPCRTCRPEAWACGCSPAWPIYCQVTAGQSVSPQPPLSAT